MGLPPGHAYVLVYGLIGGFAFWFLMFLRGWTFQGWCRRAGQDLHRNMVHRILFAPLGFFLRNPVGEMLVALTKEQDIMDEQLIDTMHYLGIYGLIILSTVITVSVTIPLFAVFGGVLILVTLVLLYFYLPAAAKLKALRIQTAGE
jgi:ABC-type multidrug transport system fused ATPase/permease subunit